MVGGGIFCELVGPAIEVVRVRPGPAVSNGLGLADGGDGGVDVAVWVRIVDDGGLGLSDGGVGGAEVLLLEVESAGAEEDDGSAVDFGDIDNDVREDEIAEINKRGSELLFVARFISFDDGGAKFDHAEVIKAEESGGKKHERNQDEDELPNPHGFEGAENSSQSVRFFTTHCYI